MYVFIRCLCEAKLEGLVIEGKADKERLEAVWSDIMAEYSEEMGNNEHRLYLLLFKQVGIIAADLFDIQELVKTLKLIYSKKLADQLNALVEGNFEFNPDDPIEYARQLQGCLDRSKSKEIDLKIKSDQLDEIKKKQNKPGKAPTVRYFNSVLITLSDYAKYRVSDEITVFEYCERVQRLNKYLDSLKK